MGLVRWRCRVEEINLQSFYEEIGEESYMRELLAAMIFREEFVPAPDVQYVHVRRNAEYFGLFAFVEQVMLGGRRYMLQAWGMEIYASVIVKLLS